MSVAKNLVAGRILEDQLFPYPQLREKDQEVLRMMVDGIDHHSQHLLILDPQLRIREQLVFQNSPGEKILCDAHEG